MPPRNRVFLLFRGKHELLQIEKGPEAETIIIEDAPATITVLLAY